MVQTEYTDEMLAEKLRDGLDGLESFTILHRIDRSLNDFFVGSAANRKANIDSYWDVNTNTIKGGLGGLWCLYSRKVFKWGFCELNTQLPTKKEGCHVVIGFEGSLGSGGGHAFFYLHPAYFYFSVGFRAIGYYFTADYFLPSDYNTAKHTYTVKVNKNNVLFIIDGEKKGIILLGLDCTIPSWTDNPPYLLGGTKVILGAMPFLIGTESRTAEITFGPMYANDPAAYDGAEITPLNLAVYTENSNTKWSALSVAADTTINSHPIPIWGYSTKTLHYKLTSALSSAKLQVYVGGDWQDYANLTVDGTYHPLTMTAEAPIARLTVTGGAGGGTINFAEFHLS